MALGFKIKNFWVDLTGKCTALGGFVGDVTGNLTGSTTGTEIIYVADGAIDTSIKSAILQANSASTDMTLSDGTYIGDEIIVSCSVSTQGATVTIETPISASSDVVTFATGDLAIFRWTSIGWGAVQGITVA